MAVNSSNSSLVVFKVAYYTNDRAEIKFYWVYFINF